MKTNTEHWSYLVLVELSKTSINPFYLLSSRFIDYMTSNYMPEEVEDLLGI